MKSKKVIFTTVAGLVVTGIAAVIVKFKGQNDIAKLVKEAQADYFDEEDQEDVIDEEPREEKED